MSEPLSTPEEYELFLYSLTDTFSGIRRSTLTFIRRGVALARVAGEVQFERGIRLVVRERLVYDRLPMRIDSYGCEISRRIWSDNRGVPRPGVGAMVKRPTQVKRPPHPDPLPLRGGEGTPARPGRRGDRPLQAVWCP